MKFIIYILIIPIKGYQLILSPLFGPSCRFQPTCSTYAIEALTKHGITYGVLLTIKFETLTSGLRVSQAWFTFAVPFGLSLLMVRIVQRVYLDVKNLRNNLPVYSGDKMFS